MIILGIDTSCDDTSIAILGDNGEILSSVVSSQADLHKLFGGIVPEIASRKHLELTEGIYGDVLREARISPKDIDLFCVTNGPGLIGSVLVGLCFAKGAALSLGKPLVGVNHVEAHALSVFLETEVDFPYIALVVSGGHTMIFLVEGFTRFRVLGSTRDDAAGEAFDKIAKFIGIGYPGGKVIEELSRKGRSDFHKFPRPMADEANYDFSFSGLKTSFLNYVKTRGIPDEETMGHILSSFQEAICHTLTIKTFRAAKDHGIKDIVVGGGVAANGRLRDVFSQQASEEGKRVFFSSPVFCTDNGAMIALAGYERFKREGASPLDIKGYSRMSIKQAMGGQRSRAWG